MMRYFLHRNVHTSWQIAASSMAVFVGIVLSPIILWQFTTLGWLLTGIALLLFACVRQRVFAIIFAIIGGLLLGLWRGQIEQAALNVYDGIYDRVIEIRGVVSDDADVDKQGNTVLRLKNVTTKNRTLPGKIWVTPPDKVSIDRSDQVILKGKVQEGFGTFAASMYRADVISIKRPQPGDVALHVRNWFADAVRQAIAEPEASLGIGYLVGQRRTLPPDLDVALQTAGLTHIVVASGYNLTILVRLARRLFVRISKYLSVLASGGLIVSFIAITGASPSMSRAGLVAGLSLLVWYYGRTVHPLVLLPFAIAVTVLINPSYAWGDVGWQLSFAAFAGVMIVAPLAQVYFFGNEKPGTIRQILGETTAAWICTLPILLYSFSYLSNVAIVANLLILPLVPLAMLLTFIAGLGTIAVPTAASLFGAPAYALLSYMTHVAMYFANLPWAKAEITISVWHVVILYVCIITGCFYMWWRTRHNLRASNIVE